MIYLDSEFMDILNDFSYFIKDLIDRRSWVDTKHPFIYDSNSKILGISSSGAWSYGNDSISLQLEDFYDRMQATMLNREELKKILEDKEE